MLGRLVITFLIHMVSISLLLIPNKFQGPVVAAISGIQLRVLDTVGIIFITAGSVFIFGSLCVCLKEQLKLNQQLPDDKGADYDK